MSNSVLKFDYELVIGKPFTQAYGVNPLVFDDGAVAYDAVGLALDSYMIEIHVDDDTDQVSVHQAPLPANDTGTARSYTVIEEAKEYVGSTIGWCWVCKNWRGYNDGFAVSFEGMDPSFYFLSEGSKIFIYRMAKVRA